MMLSCPFVEKPIKFDENKINILIIENPVVLRNTVNAFRKQGEGFVLSEEFKPVEWTKNVEFVENVFDVDFSSKALSSKINAEASRIVENYPEETSIMLQNVNLWGNIITSQFEFSADFSAVEDADRIIKILNFHICNDEMSLPEAMLEYMNICRRFLKKKLFVFLNLKSYLTVEEQTLFYKSVAYEKFDILLLEGYQHEIIEKYEKTVIIDKDLCVI